MEHHISTRDASFVVPPRHLSSATAALKSAPVDHLDLAGGLGMALLPEQGVPVTDQRALFEALPDHLRAAATITRITGDGPLAGHDWDQAEWPVFDVLDAECLAAATTLVEALDAWGWSAALHPDGTVSIENYSADSYCADSDAALAILTPYVEPGSYVHVCDEDGEHWRWVVTGDHVLAEQAGRVVFDSADAAVTTPPAGR